MNKSCCFTGHRKIKVTDEIKINLMNTIENMVNHDVTDFYAGGAIGWDMLCEMTIIDLKKKYPQIKLNLILPCNDKEQTDKWKDTDKKLFYNILKQADNVEYISEKYYNGCMKKRNQKLILYSDYCICYYNNKRKFSGTGQTVRMAEIKNIGVINLCNTG